jgi:acyl-CoA dehydrogenase
MSEAAPMLHDALDRLLADVSPPRVVRGIEAGAAADSLWHALDGSGFADALVAESAGGAGLSMAEAAPLFFLCGRHALPLPLAQTMAARGACVRNGIAVPDGPVAIAPPPVAGTGDALHCRNVPFGRVARWVIVPQADPAGHDWLLPAAAAERADTGVNGSLRAHLSWPDPRSAAVVLRDALPWPEIAAALTAAQMAGAMEAVLQMTVRYAGERVQFGRPIGKFQAVQQQLAVLAELATASRIGAELGCRETAPGSVNRLAAAVAKARASEAAGTVVSIAHAVHAAIGITAEYDLQLFTRRLIEWRSDHGAAAYWQRRIGDAVLASDARTTLEFMLPALFPAGD